MDYFEVIAKNWKSESIDGFTSTMPRLTPSHQPHHEDTKLSRDSLWTVVTESNFDRDRDENEAWQTQLNCSLPLERDSISRFVPISISGITGGYASYVNGIYLPTNELSHDWPIYKRVNQRGLPLEFQEMFLCFELQLIPSAGATPSQSKSAWVVKNSNGVIYARCRLPNGEHQISPERIQFTDQGILRKDLCWEMKSSVNVFGFRKRFGGVMQPASQWRLQPELKEEMFEISKPIPRDSLSPSHPLEDLHPRVNFSSL